MIFVPFFYSFSAADFHFVGVLSYRINQEPVEHQIMWSWIGQTLRKPTQHITSQVLSEQKENGKAKKHREMKADMEKTGCKWKEQEVQALSSGEELLMACGMLRWGVKKLKSSWCFIHETKQHYCLDMAACQLFNYT